MPNWLEAEYRECGNCGKRFEVFRSSLWAYKQNNVYFCTWRCLRENEKRGQKGSVDMSRKLTLEQKKKAVQIAISGGDPLSYLKDCGSDAPDKTWWVIKNKLKETQPDLYAQIPDGRKKKRAEKPEKPTPKDGGDWIPSEKEEPKTEEQTITVTAREINDAINRDFPGINEPFLPVATEVKINLNDRVKVKLTVLGIKTYINYMDEVNNGRTENPAIKPKDCIPTIDDDGYSTFQLWQLFNIYGEYMTMASEPMFLPLDIIKVGLDKPIKGHNSYGGNKK